MSLRNRLLALSLLTLLLPWSAWKLLQELEGFLRSTQEVALFSTARSLAASLPFETQSQLNYSPDRYVTIRNLEHAPVMDGFSDDWPDPQQGFESTSLAGEQKVKLLVGADRTGLFLFFDIQNVVFPNAGNNRIEVLLRSPRGLLRFDIHPEAPGPLQLFSNAGGGQAEGFWLDTEQGFRVELSVPAITRNTELAFQLGAEPEASNGSISTSAGDQEWLTLLSPGDALAAKFLQSVAADTQAWLVNSEGWVLADSGMDHEQLATRTTWVQRLLYRLVAGQRTAVESAISEPMVRLQSAVVLESLGGVEAHSWSQEADTAAVRNTVSVPVVLDGRVRGAIVLQSASEGLLLLTNRALGRLLITTLLISFGLAGGLWFFATRLSQRVRRLSAAVSHAMDGGVVADALPLTGDRDELGELARNNDKLLKAVADYNQYLQTLAGKLSHELKTPLAITRSSLENLSSQELGGEAQEFLQRAQEGVERQAAIIRAMSEASRLEAAIEVAEWEETDLVNLIGKCAENYLTIHTGRRIESRSSEQTVRMRCAPELLVQALDKLVDNAISLSNVTDVVTISLDRAEDSYLLSVRNTGSQLPETHQERMFDSLVSLRVKKGATPNLGLGLYIVRLVAQAHDGWVSASNLPDKQGVEFVLHLPV
jgi:two-component system sensor histidine kinase ChvG